MDTRNEMSCNDKKCKKKTNKNKNFKHSIRG